MQKSTARVLCLVVSVILLIISSAAHGSGKPDVVSHEVQLLKDAVSVVVRWQCEYPVVKAIASAGGHRKEFPLDAYDDNVKDAYGYHGETSLELEVDAPKTAGARITYTIYVIDDVGRKSRPVTGSVKVLSDSPTDKTRSAQNGSDDLSRAYVAPPAGEKEPGMREKVLKVMEKHDTPPAISEVRINMLGESRISIFSRCTDDRGLREVKVRVQKKSGEVVKERIFTDLGRIWSGTTEAYDLGQGEYHIIVRAVDSAGNLSPEKIKDLSIGGNTEADALPPVTVASLPDGEYATPQRVTLTCSDKGGSGCSSTYYTTDGTVPTESSKKYTAPISIATTTTLRYYSTDGAGNRENPRSSLYTIKAPQDEKRPGVSADKEAPVLSIAVPSNTKAGEETNAIIYVRDNLALKTLELSIHAPGKAKSALKSITLAGKEYKIRESLDTSREGPVTVLARANDESGNWSEWARGIIQVRAELPQANGPASFEVTPEVGGSLTLSGDEETEGIRIAVPPEAVRERTRITIGKDDSPAEFDKKGVLWENYQGTGSLEKHLEMKNGSTGSHYFDPVGLYFRWLAGEMNSAELRLSLEPGGTAFSKPVNITIPRSLINLPENAEASHVSAVISRRTEEGKLLWDYVTSASLDDNFLHLGIEHFSGLGIIWNFLKSPLAAAGWILDGLPEVRDYSHDFAQAIVCSGTEPRLEAKRLPNRVDLLWYLANPVLPGSFGYWRARGVPQDGPGFNKRLKELGLRNGREDELVDWIRKRKNNSVSVQDLFRKAYSMSRGDVFQSFLLCHNALRGHAYGKGWGNRSDANIQSRMKPLVGIGDASGQRYHLFGTALYGFMSRHTSSMENPYPQYVRTVQEDLQRDLTVFVEEGIVSGDLTTEPEEAAVDRRGYDIGRNFYDHVLGNTIEDIKEGGRFRVESACPVEIVRVNVRPDPARVGQQINFEAFTSGPASSVELNYNKQAKSGSAKTFEMSPGKDGRYWSFTGDTEREPGKVLYRITAYGQGGREDDSESGSLKVEASSCAPQVTIPRDRFRFPNRIVLKPGTSTTHVYVNPKISYDDPACPNARHELRWWKTTAGAEEVIETPAYIWPEGNLIRGFAKGENNVAVQACTGDNCGKKVTATFEVVERTFWVLGITKKRPGKTYKTDYSFEITEKKSGEKPRSYAERTKWARCFGPATREEAQSFVRRMKGNPELAKNRLYGDINMNAYAIYNENGDFMGWENVELDRYGSATAEDSLYRDQAPGRYTRW